MGYDTIGQARKSQSDEAARIRQIADEQQQKAGYHRTEAFTPNQRANRPYTPSSERAPDKEAPLPPSKPLLADKASEPVLKRKSYGVNEGDQ